MGILQARILEWVVMPPSRGIFPTQGSNPGLQHCRQILYCLNHQGSPWILEWVAYPFSRGSPWPRNQTWVSCITGGFFTSWAARGAIHPAYSGPKCRCLHYPCYHFFGHSSRQASRSNISQMVWLGSVDYTEIGPLWNVDALSQKTSSFVVALLGHLYMALHHLWTWFLNYIVAFLDLMKKVLKVRYQRYFLLSYSVSSLRTKVTSFISWPGY